MSKSDNLTDFLVDIADTIRAEKSTTDPINPQDFSTEIENISDEKHTEGYNEGIDYQKSLLTSLDVTENGTYTDENGYNEVNVNVTGGGKVVLKDGTKLAYSTFTTIPEEYDFREVSTFGSLFNSSKLVEARIEDSFTRDCTSMFQDCSDLISVSLPNLIPTNCYSMFKGDYKLKSVDLSNTSLCKNFSNMFDSSAIEIAPQLDTSSALAMSSMFYNCQYLIDIPYFETSSVTEMRSMFSGCSTLTTIPQLDTSNVTVMTNLFNNCISLEALPELECPKITAINNYFTSTMSSLTTVGGWKNLKCNWNDNYGLYVCPNLTYESCINVLNGLYDFTGNGETPTSSQGNLKVHQNFLDLVGDEISIGTDKGWTITS